MSPSKLNQVAFFSPFHYLFCESTTFYSQKASASIEMSLESRLSKLEKIVEGQQHQLADQHDQIVDLQEQVVDLETEVTLFKGLHEVLLLGQAAFEL